jgi:hypothetical protein
MFRDDAQRPPVVWESEPYGIAIEYYNGLPIGTLQGVLVADDRNPAARSPFLNAEPVRRGGTHEAGSTGTLYLRINDHPAQRADNSGTATVQIRELK